LKELNRQKPEMLNRELAPGRAAEIQAFSTTARASAEQVAVNRGFQPEQSMFVCHPFRLRRPFALADGQGILNFAGRAGNGGATDESPCHHSEM
jgi:hypothetical protein